MFIGDHETHAPRELAKGGGHAEDDDPGKLATIFTNETVSRVQRHPAKPLMARYKADNALAHFGFGFAYIPERYIRYLDIVGFFLS